MDKRRRRGGRDKESRTDRKTAKMDRQCDCADNDRHTPHVEDKLVMARVFLFLVLLKE